MLWKMEQHKNPSAFEIEANIKHLKIVKHFISNQETVNDCKTI